MSGSIIFLLTVFALIPGIPAGYQCPIYCSETTFCCPGYYCIAEECHKSNLCSQPGQTVLQVGNATQDNRCWCDITRGYAPERPKLCMQTNDPSDCHCSERCPNGTTPHIKDEFGNWKLYFMPKNDCKINCETHLENTQRELKDLNGTFQNVSRQLKDLNRTNQDVTGDRDIWKYILIGIVSGIGAYIGIPVIIAVIIYIVRCCKKKSETNEPGDELGELIGPPSSPGTPEVTNSVTVKWEAPENDGSSEIIFYHVEYRKVHDDQWVRANKPLDLTRAIPNLSEGCEYDFRVIAENGKGESSPSQPVRARVLGGREPIDLHPHGREGNPVPVNAVNVGTVEEGETSGIVYAGAAGGRAVTGVHAQIW